MAKEHYWEVYNLKPSRYINSASCNPSKTELLKLIFVTEFIQKKNSSLTLEKREGMREKDGQKHCYHSA